MLKIAKRTEIRLLAALVAGGVVLSPALAATAGKKQPAAVSLSFDTLSSFTPANADPKLAAALGSRNLQLTDFKFTPAPAKGRPSQVRVAIRARSNAPAQSRLAEAAAAPSVVTPLTPTSYNLGVAVGWRSFAVSGDVAKMLVRRDARRRGVAECANGNDSQGYGGHHSGASRRNGECPSVGSTAAA